MEWRESDGVRWLEAELGEARAAFGTRLGGVSEAPFDTLNLGILTADSPAAVAENRRRLAAALGHEAADVPVALQVHGAAILVHDDPQRPSPFAEPGAAELAEADGHVVRAPGLAPLVLTADCLPVAVSGPDGAAILHCGWRGLAAGMIAAGVEAVAATDAAIGPGIGQCCYEVGEEVLAAFADLDGVAAGRMLDLAAVARQLLARAGVARVESAGLCTRCEPELFFSHRRDAGRTGRQGSLVWIEPAAA